MINPLVPHTTFYKNSKPEREGLTEVLSLGCSQTELIMTEVSVILKPTGKKLPNWNEGL